MLGRRADRFGTGDFDRLRTGDRDKSVRLRDLLGDLVNKARMDLVDRVGDTVGRIACGLGEAECAECTGRLGPAECAECTGMLRTAGGRSNGGAFLVFSGFGLAPCLSFSLR